MISIPKTPFIALTTLVLAAHVLLLQSAPLHFAFGDDSANSKLHTFSTRSIHIQPAPEPGVATPSAAQSAPISEVKQAVASDLPVDVASNSGANQLSADAPTPARSAGQGSGTAAVAAVNIPGSVRLGYGVTGQAKGMNYSAKAELAWLHDGHKYDLSLVVSAWLVGSRSMTSTGQIGPDGLMPTRFADKGRSELAAHFNPAQGKITFSANTPDAPWLKGAQDRVSLFIQLGGLLAGNPARYPVGSTISIYTVGPREAETWIFSVEKEEALNLPYGNLATLKLTRLPRQEFDQKVEIWYAPELAYLPVRNKITQNSGDFVDQQLQVVETP